MLATGVAFVFGVFVLMVPFITMTIIYKSREVIRKKRFVRKFGMLSDELRKKSLL